MARKHSSEKNQLLELHSVLLKKTGKMSKKWGLILMKGNLKLSKEITGSESSCDSDKTKASHSIVMDKIEHKRPRQRALCNPKQRSGVQEGRIHFLPRGALRRSTEDMSFSTILVVLTSLPYEFLKHRQCAVDLGKESFSCLKQLDQISQ